MGRKGRQSLPGKFLPNNTTGRQGQGQVKVATAASQQKYERYKDVLLDGTVGLPMVQQARYPAKCLWTWRVFGMTSAI